MTDLTVLGMVRDAKLRKLADLDKQEFVVRVYLYGDCIGEVRQDYSNYPDKAEWYLVLPRGKVYSRSLDSLVHRLVEEVAPIVRKKLADLTEGEAIEASIKAATDVINVYADKSDDAGDPIQRLRYTLLRLAAVRGGFNKVTNR